MITMDASARSSKQIDFLTLVCVLVLLALPLIIFWPVTLGKQIWVGGDFSTFSYPLFVFNSQQWLHGHVPLWNPYLYGGTPALATQEGGAFYPLNLILWLTLPPASALASATLIHLSLTGLSVFCLLRSLRLSLAAAFLGAITVELGGFAMSHLGHLVILRALPWIGFAMVCHNRWIESGRRRWLAGIAATVGLLCLSGHPQTIIYGSIFVLTYLLFARPASLSSAALSMIAAGLGVALGAVQLLPGIVLVLNRDLLTLTEGSYDAFTALSYHPAYLLTLIFPRARSGTYAEMVGYVGLTPLLLASASFCFREEGDSLRTKRFFGVWAGVALILSLGLFVPVLTRWLSRIPVYGSVSRVPSRHLLEFGYSLAVLAAFGLDAILRRRRMQWPAWPVLLVLALGLGSVTYLAFTSPFTRDIPSLQWQPASFQTVWQPLLILLLALALLVGLRRITHAWLRRLSIIALLALSLYDLASLGTPIYAPLLTSPDFLQADSASAAEIRKMSPEQPVRVLAFEAFGDNKALLAPNYAEAFGTESLIGNESLVPRRFISGFGRDMPMTGQVELEALKRPAFRTLLDLFGVKYLLVKPNKGFALAPYYTLGGEVKGAAIYLNSRARPRLFQLLPLQAAQSKSQRLGESLSLVSYAVAHLADGEPGYTLFTGWFCREALPVNYTLFVHYLDESGKTIAQGDQLLEAGFPADGKPTREWECPGYFWNESHVPPEAVRGDKIHAGLGLWVPETQVRLTPAPGELPIDAAGRINLEFERPQTDAAIVAPPFLDEHGGLWAEPDGTNASAPTVQQTYYDGDRISADVAFDRAGILVHATNYITGWKATVDGVSAPVLPVAGLVQGVQVPSGQHRVEFRYAPNAFTVGAAISVLALGVVALLVLWRQKGCE